MKTGELASRCGVNIQTVRYYERRGLHVDLEPVWLERAARVEADPATDRPA